MNYSYILGIEDLHELEENGFDVQLVGNHYGVTFSDDKIELFEDFICKNLEKGFWNEYLGKDKVFIFKFEDGEIKKYILNKINEDEILLFCREFANYNFESIAKMLRDNEFYSTYYFKK